MNKYLCLDDYRKVEDCLLTHDGIYKPNEKQFLLEATNTNKWDWDLVKSFDEFKKYIDENGIPLIISFDNDLCEKHYIGDFSTEKSGLDCLLYLIDKCKELNRKLPVCYVHSFNPIRRKMMKDIIREQSIFKKNDDC
jgi:hypothetical protein